MIPLTGVLSEVTQGKVSFLKLTVFHDVKFKSDVSILCSLMMSFTSKKYDIELGPTFECIRKSFIQLTRDPNMTWVQSERWFCRKTGHS